MAIDNNININLKANDNASKSFDKLRKSTGKLWASVKKMTPNIKQIWIWLWVVWAAVWVAWKKFFDLADSIETTIWKSQVVFWEYFDDIQKVADETAKSMWLTKNEYLKAASWMADLLKPMWFTTEQAKKMTEKTIWLAWALAEWSNWQFDATQASEILQKAMLWETEQLKSMWISISTWSEEFKKLQEEITRTTGATWQQAKALTVQKMLFDKSTDAQKAFAEWADSLTRKKAEMLATLWNVRDTIAKSLIPAFHSIINTLWPVITKLWESIQKWFENEENVKKLTDAIKLFITWITFAKDVIVATVRALNAIWEVLWLVAFKIFEFTESVVWFFTTMWEWIINVWENVKQWTINVFKWMVDIVKPIIDWIVWVFRSAFDQISKIWSKITGLVWKVSWAVSWAVSSAASAVWLDWTKANWGPVMAWQTVKVWERWAETFTPSQDWFISPAWSWASININMWWVTVNNEQDADMLARKIKEALVNESRLFNIWIS